MIKKSFSYIGISFLNLLSLLPLSFLYVISKGGYYFIYYIFGYRRLVVRENLTNSFPEKSASEIAVLEKMFFKYFADLVVEVIKLASISETELLKRVKFNNLELVEDYINNSQSILACTGHYGNWELGMMALGLRVKATAYVIYKPLSNPSFDTWFYKIRTSTSNYFIPMRQTLRSIASTRNKITMYCFAGDQTPVKNEARVWINFLHQPTPVLQGIEKIAFQTNRPVIYFNMQLVKQGYYEVDCYLVAEKPVETKEGDITKINFRLLEEIITTKPAYWLWSHRRWKHKPENL
ncbi:MAG: lysophospholipid acyltransferase family protein [Pedobacter sp.]|nr:lysophospholipid acyltransferase family protein [Pedobacter sp.]